ncbi:hypothetical protein RhiTH_008912 [Rhizoctonia solani]
MYHHVLQSLRNSPSSSNLLLQFTPFLVHLMFIFKGSAGFIFNIGSPSGVTSVPFGPNAGPTGENEKDPEQPEDLDLGDDEHTYDIQHFKPEDTMKFLINGEKGSAEVNKAPHFEKFPYHEWVQNPNAKWGFAAVCQGLIFIHPKCKLNPMHLNQRIANPNRVSPSLEIYGIPYASPETSAKFEAEIKQLLTDLSKDFSVVQIDDMFELIVKCVELLLKYGFTAQEHLDDVNHTIGLADFRKKMIDLQGIWVLKAKE